MAHKSLQPVAIVTLSFLMITAASAAETGARVADPDPVTAIRAVLDRQSADWNKHDLDAFLTGYWNSPKLVFQSGGRRTTGWDTIRDRYRSRYQGPGKSMGQLTFSALEIELLAPEVALVTGSWRVTMPDGSQPHGLFTLIMRHFADGWKIVHDHTSADDAPGTAPAANPKNTTG